MKRYNYLILVICASFGWHACSLSEAQKVDLVELGLLKKEYVLDKEASRIEVEVYSNGPFHIEYGGEKPEWISANPGTMSGDQKVVFECQRNDEFKRSATVIFRSEVDQRRDTVKIKQQGNIEALLEMNNTSVISEGRGCVVTAPIRTNIPFSYMTVKTDYESGSVEPWIKSAEILPDSAGGDNCSVKIETLANEDVESPRSAVVEFSFVDGWEDKVAVQVNVIQKTAGEVLGDEMDFNAFRQEYADNGVIKDYVIIEGIVVSNTPSGNAGENEQMTSSSIDYTISQRTVYLQSVDGNYGLSLLCVNPEDNIFNQWDRVKLLMRGAEVAAQFEPTRYNVTGLTKAMVVSQIKGTKSDIAPKVRHINELKDDDVYTYVTLADVEIPVRKGSIAPMNEGYTLCSDSHRIAKYPRLFRDINGDAMYFYTNTVCVYRSDGTRLPYGSGNLSGVIVHERFSRFEWKDGADPLDIADDVTLGNIGRYQLRHQTKEDIWGEMKDSVEDSFSAILTEFRFWNPDVDNHYQLPTYGTNGWLDHTYQRKYTGSSSKEYMQGTYQQHMTSSGSYSYLGPVGHLATCMFGLNVGNKNGIGCVLDTKKEHYNSLMEDLISKNPDGTIEWCGQYAPDPNAGHGPSGWSSKLPSDCPSINYGGSSSMKGKGTVNGNCFVTFSSSYWWDYDTNRPYGWLVNFSTEGISTNHLSMQIAVMNGQQSWYTPRFWKAEWSYTDSQAPADDSQWHLLKEYTVPDVSVNSNTLFSSIVAYKHIDFELPLEILGHRNVYIRLVPINDICSDGSDYANAHMSGNPTASQHISVLEYLAIRYNK